MSQMRISAKELVEYFKKHHPDVKTTGMDYDVLLALYKEEEKKVLDSAPVDDLYTVLSRVDVPCNPEDRTIEEFACVMLEDSEKCPNWAQEVAYLRSHASELVLVSSADEMTKMPLLDGIIRQLLFCPITGGPATIKAEAAPRAMSYINRILCGTDEGHYFFECCKTSSSGVCGKPLCGSEMAYKCLQCAIDSTCVMCVECFHQSPCVDHEYRMIFSAGGMCDCGDPTAWNKSSFCKNHSANTDIDPLDKIPAADLPWIETCLKGCALLIMRIIHLYNTIEESSVESTYNISASVAPVIPPECLLEKSFSASLQIFTDVAVSGDTGKRLVAYALTSPLVMSADPHKVYSGDSFGREESVPEEIAGISETTLLDDLVKFDLNRYFLPMLKSGPWSLVNPLFRQIVSDPAIKLSVLRSFLKYSESVPYYSDTTMTQKEKKHAFESLLSRQAVQVITVPWVSESALYPSKLKLGYNTTIVHRLLSAHLFSVCNWAPNSISFPVFPPQFRSGSLHPLIKISKSSKDPFQAENHTLYNLNYALSASNTAGNVMATSEPLLRAICICCQATHFSDLIRRDEESDISDNQHDFASWEYCMTFSASLLPMIANSWLRCFMTLPADSISKEIVNDTDDNNEDASAGFKSSPSACVNSNFDLEKLLPLEVQNALSTTKEFPLPPMSSCQTLTYVFKEQLERCRATYCSSAGCSGGLFPLVNRMSLMKGIVTVIGEYLNEIAAVGKIAVSPTVRVLSVRSIASVRSENEVYFCSGIGDGKIAGSDGFVPNDQSNSPVEISESTIQSKENEIKCIELRHYCPLTDKNNCVTFTAQLVRMLGFVLHRFLVSEKTSPPSSVGNMLSSIKSSNTHSDAFSPRQIPYCARTLFRERLNEAMRTACAPKQCAGIPVSLADWSDIIISIFVLRDQAEDQHWNRNFFGLKRQLLMYQSIQTSRIIEMDYFILQCFICIGGSHNMATQMLVRYSYLSSSLDRYDPTAAPEGYSHYLILLLSLIGGDTHSSTDRNRSLRSRVLQNMAVAGSQMHSEILNGLGKDDRQDDNNEHKKVHERESIIDSITLSERVKKGTIRKIKKDAKLWASIPAYNFSWSSNDRQAATENYKRTFLHPMTEKGDASAKISPSNDLTWFPRALVGSHHPALLDNLRLVLHSKASVATAMYAVINAALMNSPPPTSVINEEESTNPNIEKSQSETKSITEAPEESLMKATLQGSSEVSQALSKNPPRFLSIEDNFLFSAIDFLLLAVEDAKMIAVEEEEACLERRQGNITVIDSGSDSVLTLPELLTSIRERRGSFVDWGYFEKWHHRVSSSCTDSLFDLKQFLPLPEIEEYSLGEHHESPAVHNLAEKEITLIRFLLNNRLYQRFEKADQAAEDTKRADIDPFSTVFKIARPITLIMALNQLLKFLRFEFESEQTRKIKPWSKDDINQLIFKIQRILTILRNKPSEDDMDPEAAKKKTEEEAAAAAAEAKAVEDRAKRVAAKQKSLMEKMKKKQESACAAFSIDGEDRKSKKRIRDESDVVCSQTSLGASISEEPRKNMHVELMVKITDVECCFCRCSEETGYPLMWLAHAASSSSITNLRRDAVASSNSSQIYKEDTDKPSGDSGGLDTNAKDNNAPLKTSNPVRTNVSIMMCGHGCHLSCFAKHHVYVNRMRGRVARDLAISNSGFRGMQYIGGAELSCPICSKICTTLSLMPRLPSTTFSGSSYPLSGSDTIVQGFFSDWVVGNILGDSNTSTDESKNGVLNGGLLGFYRAKENLKDAISATVDYVTSLSTPFGEMCIDASIGFCRSGERSAICEEESDLLRKMMGNVINSKINDDSVSSYFFKVVSKAGDSAGKNFLFEIMQYGHILADSFKFITEGTLKIGATIAPSQVAGGPNGELHTNHLIMLTSLLTSICTYFVNYVTTESDVIDCFEDVESDTSSIDISAEILKATFDCLDQFGSQNSAIDRSFFELDAIQKICAAVVAALVTATLLPLIHCKRMSKVNDSETLVCSTNPVGDMHQMMSSSVENTIATILAPEGLAKVICSIIESITQQEHKFISPETVSPMFVNQDSLASLWNALVPLSLLKFTLIGVPFADTSVLSFPVEVETPVDNTSVSNSNPAALSSTAIIAKALWNKCTALIHYLIQDPATGENTSSAPNSGIVQLITHVEKVSELLGSPSSNSSILSLLTQGCGSTIDHAGKRSLTDVFFQSIFHHYSCNKHTAYTPPLRAERFVNEYTAALAIKERCKSMIFLPLYYSDYIKIISEKKRTCSQCNATPRTPFICLRCRSVLCYRARKPEILNHARACGGGLSVYLISSSSSLVVVSAVTERATQITPVYVDRFGETDDGLVRGDALRLNVKYYVHDLLLPMMMNTWDHDTVALETAFRHILQRM